MDSSGGPITFTLDSSGGAEIGDLAKELDLN